MSRFLKNIFQLGKETFVYGLSGILGRFISFLTLPFFARSLSVADYGDISLLQAYFFFGSAVSLMGLDSAILRWYYDNDDILEKKGSVSNGVIMIQILSFIVSLITFTLIYFHALPKLNQNNRLLLYGLIAVNILTGWLTSVFIVWCRVRHKPWWAFAYSLFTILTSVFFSFILVITFKKGVVGFIGGQSISLILTYILGLVIMRQWIIFRIDIAQIKHMLKYGLGIMPANLATSGMILLSNILLSHFTSQQELGYYQMALNFAMLVTLVTNAFGQSWQPFSFSIMNQLGAKIIYSKIMVAYAAIMVLVCVFVGLFSNELIVIIASPKFLPSAPLIGIIAIAYFLNSLSTVAVTGMSISKDVSWYSPAVIIGCGIIIVLTWIIVPVLGRFGLAFSMLFGYGIIPTILFYRSQKIYAIPYNFKILFFFVAIGLLIIISNSYNSFPLYTKMLIALSFCAIIIPITFIFLKTHHFTLQLSKRKLNPE